MIDYHVELQKLLQENPPDADAADALSGDIQRLNGVLAKINGRQADISMQVEEIYEKLEDFPAPREDAGALIALLDILEDFVRYARGEDALRDQARMMWGMAGRAAAKAGLMRLEGEGLPFDAATQEIEGMTYAEDVPHGSVMDILQSGYMRDGEILRKARVIVNGRRGEENGHA